MFYGLIAPAKNPTPVSESLILRNPMKASECKCVECGKQAVAFWPMIDPDIPAHPYCRKCLDKAKAEVVAKALGLPDAVAKKVIKNYKSHETD